MFCFFFLLITVLIRVLLTDGMLKADFGSSILFIVVHCKATDIFFVVLA